MRHITYEMDVMELANIDTWIFHRKELKYEFDMFNQYLFTLDLVVKLKGGNEMRCVEMSLFAMILVS